MTKAPDNQARRSFARLKRSRVKEGLPFPLGASWDGLGR